jgi:hypothetical protein
MTPIDGRRSAAAAEDVGGVCRADGWPCDVEGDEADAALDDQSMTAAGNHVPRKPMRRMVSEVSHDSSDLHGHAPDVDGAKRPRGRGDVARRFADPAGDGRALPPGKQDDRLDEPLQPWSDRSSIVKSRDGRSRQIA